MTLTEQAEMLKDLGAAARFLETVTPMPTHVATTLNTLLVIGFVLIEYPEQVVVDDMLRRAVVIARRLAGRHGPSRSRAT